MASLKEQLQQHSNALLLISGLVIVKFIVLPVMQWQESTLIDNALLKKRLSKSAYAIENKDKMQQVLQKTLTQLKKTQQLTYAYQPKNIFQLNQQKHLENLFEQFQIEITQLVWQAPILLNQWQLNQHSVQIRFSGTVTGLQKLQAALESQPQWLANNDFNYRLEKRRGRRLGKVTGRMSISLYMRRKDNL